MANTACTDQRHHARHQARGDHHERGPQGKALQVNENSVEDPSPPPGPAGNHHDKELEGNSLQVNENSKQPKR